MNAQQNVTDPTELSGPRVGVGGRVMLSFFLSFFKQGLSLARVTCGTHYVPPTGLKHVAILLSQPLKCWDHRYKPQHLDLINAFCC